MYQLLSLIVMVAISIVVHWKVSKYIFGSFLSSLISTVIISFGSLFIVIDHAEILINAISVFVFSLLVSAIVGFFFNRKRNKAQYKRENNKPERYKEYYMAMELALIFSGIAIILLALFDDNTPLHLSIEGIFQLVIVLLLRKRWRWAFNILVGYVSLAIIVILSAVFTDLFLNLGLFNPKEIVGTIFGVCVAGLLCFKGARAYKKIISLECTDLKQNT